MAERTRATTRLPGRPTRGYGVEPAARRPKRGSARGGLRRLRRLAYLAVLAALAFGGWWLIQSPLLRVQEVTVEGTRLLDPEQVAAAAGLRGTSVLFPDTGGARRRIESEPMVKSVTFERDWPRGMRIIVQERRPWGFWESEGQRHVIDEDGVVLERLLPDEGAPVIRDLDGTGNLQPGDRVDSDAVALTRQLAEAAPQRLGLALAAVEYSNTNGLTATFEGGLRVTLGDGSDFDYKMAALKALLERNRQQGVEVRSVDLRFGERIAFQ